MSIMRTKGQGNLVVNKNRFSGKAIITSTPISAGSWMANYYQPNQTQKNPNFDTIGKLVIQNYAKDLMSGIFYGWDIIAADETEDSYLFQLRNRTDNTLRVYITLSRVLQYAELPYYPEMMYQCYIHDDAGNWSSRNWIRAKDISYKNFWELIEETITSHHLPF